MKKLVPWAGKSGIIMHEAKIRLGPSGARNRVLRGWEYSIFQIVFEIHPKCKKSPYLYIKSNIYT